MKTTKYRAGTAQGEELEGFSPPTFVLFKIKVKESSNKIAEEISLVRNGVKLHLTLAKVDADIKGNVSNDNY